MTAASATIALLGILLGWRGPRSPRLTLALGSLCIALSLALGLVAGSRMSFLGAAASAAFIAAATVLVPALAGRFLLLVWAGIAVAGIVAPLFWQRAHTIVLVLGILLAALGAWRRPRRLLAVVCALVGGWLVVQGLELARGWVVLTSAALFGLQELHRRRWQEPRPVRQPRRPALLGGLAAALIAAAGVLVLPAVVGELPRAPVAATVRPELTPLPFEERRIRLREAAPHGGLVWPLPSESLLWDGDVDRDLYPRVENLDARFLGAEVRGLRRLPGTDLRGMFSLHPAMVRLRRVPDPPALARLRMAARATALALAEVAPRARDDLPEAELARLIEEAMERRGCAPGAFPPIVASGASVGDGHGSGNRGRLVNGALVVVDVGCRVDGYVSDFTRTLPVGGRFAPRTLRVYQAVLEAQQAAERACGPGAFLGARAKDGARSLERIAREVITRQLGHDPMKHALGHTVGLFVHDVPIGGPLQPGMVITLEPGAYLADMGARIEDMFLVTETGCQRLTDGFPAGVSEVEALMTPGSGR